MPTWMSIRFQKYQSMDKEQNFGVFCQERLQNIRYPAIEYKVTFTICRKARQVSNPSIPLRTFRFLSAVCTWPVINSEDDFGHLRQGTIRTKYQSEYRTIRASNFY